MTRTLDDLLAATPCTCNPCATVDCCTADDPCDDRATEWTAADCARCTRNLRTELTLDAMSARS